jgi:hypothetical protein
MARVTATALILLLMLPGCRRGTEAHPDAPTTAALAEIDYLWLINPLIWEEAGFSAPTRIRLLPVADEGSRAWRSHDWVYQNGDRAGSTVEMSEGTAVALSKRARQALTPEEDASFQALHRREGLTRLPQGQNLVRRGLNDQDNGLLDYRGHSGLAPQIALITGRPDRKPCPWRSTKAWMDVEPADPLGMIASPAEAVLCIQDIHPLNDEFVYRQGRWSHEQCASGRLRAVACEWLIMAKPDAGQRPAVFAALRRCIEQGDRSALVLAAHCRWAGREQLAELWKIAESDEGLAGEMAALQLACLVPQELEQHILRKRATRLLDLLSRRSFPDDGEDVARLVDRVIDAQRRQAMQAEEAQRQRKAQEEQEHEEQLRREMELHRQREEQQRKAAEEQQRLQEMQRLSR